MKRFVRLIVWLYPRSWRQRYGVGFNALLEDVEPGRFDFLDVLKGALEMHLKIGLLGKPVALFGVAGLLAAAALSFTLQDNYRSEAVVTLQDAEGHVLALKSSQDGLGRLMRQALDRGSLITIIEKQHLYESERASKPMDEIVEKMRSDIRITLKSPASFAVSFDSADAARAQQTTSDLMTRLIEGNLQLAETSPSPATGFRLTAGPFMPPTAVGPNRPVISGIGLAAGFLVGLAVVWLRHPRAQELT
jgi:hypothetical protein